MKRMLASLVGTLASLPVVGFACGGGDCSMDLPPPEVPAPTTVENLMSSLSAHQGLFAALALGAILAVVVSRQRKLLETKSAAPLGNPVA